ncbi:hypothetical protein L602_001500000140 [Cupriavidus gilardii J11]|uniref:Uncharacterized protein n=1 Tax=Cupriavidus gilardii J11 TaxID=936133 RepID=A0A562BRT1_9BURK|nr:hypothetical protein [Cupriavidus gilardii]TWG87881.1 hypothetical protein L602_001500000140 [Cupriavidus gilardii J11]
MFPSSSPDLREVCLGPRPCGEREIILPGDPQYADIARLDSLTFKRYLDRVFWYPRREVLRFEVRTVQSSRSGYEVVALVTAGEGEAWFSIEAVPARWDCVAIHEINHGLAVMEAANLKELGHLPADYEPFSATGPVLDHSHLEDPEEVELRRWDVINRIRAVSRSVRDGASLSG